MNSTTYYILEREKLIVEVYEGEVTERELVALKEELFDDNKYNPSYHFISDFRNASIKFNKKDLVDFVEYLSNCFYHNDSNKVSVLSSTPVQVAYYTLFIELSYHLPLDFMVHDTVNSACTWLGVRGKEIGFIEDVIALLSAQ
ncbi:hypothetical protein [Carboxylicivirga sp. RSCT41]|uniref:hypothetical protein n=1 Tax=Carboxylicivirga agarovorans TaxID=3417570 RepID=UPI003D32D6DA